MRREEGGGCNEIGHGGRVGLCDGGQAGDEEQLGQPLGHGVGHGLDPDDPQPRVEREDEEWSKERTGPVTTNETTAGAGLEAHLTARVDRREARRRTASTCSC